MKQKEQYHYQDLVKIVALLRGEGGCPWDREQDHKSIRKNLIEEAYEVAEAIDMESDKMLREELGDLMLQVVFHAQMASEEGTFDENDVADGICKKLILRHPHIFADVRVDGSEQVLSNWEDIKKSEKGFETQTEVLKSVSKVLPALMRSQKVQQKAAKVGFDFKNVKGALDKLREETDELCEAVLENNRRQIEEELGDLFFSAVNVSRFLHIDAEESLSKACDKFVKRFETMEKMALIENKSLQNLDFFELDVLWDKAKQCIISSN